MGHGRVPRGLLFDVKVERSETERSDVLLPLDNWHIGQKSHFLPDYGVYSKMEQSRIKNQRGDNRELGRKGEDLAARHLEALGFRIIGRNVTNPLGELDIVALDGQTVVIVEVKTRSYAGGGRRPADAVDWRKRKKLTQVATLFLRAAQWRDHPARFDVVEVTSPPGGAPIVNHIRSAFAACS